MSRITRLLLTSTMAVAIGISAAAAPVHSAPSPAPSERTQQTYTVKPGDYLFLIARKLQVSFDDLLAVNGLTKRSVIHPGDRLIVPAGGVVTGGSTSTPQTTGAVYTVKPGDYFERIARDLGVSIDDLLAVNGMKKSTVIHPGTKLKIPAGGKAPAAPDSSPDATSVKITTVINFATAQLGEPYSANSAGPNSWDCSGLTMRAYAAIGIKLPHYSAAQAKYGTAVDWTTQGIRPGDLVFLATGRTISHVGIATSATTYIQAPGTGDVVRTGKIPMHRVVAVRRLVTG